MEIHLRRHTLWVCEWGIAFSSSKNTVMLFGKTEIQKLIPIQLFGSKYHGSGQHIDLGVTVLDMELTWSAYFNPNGRKAAIAEHARLPS
jgi:hypothetical protein